MVIIQKPVGQLCNQLFTMVHFAAAAIEHDFRVFFPGFQYPLECFPNINSESRFRVMNLSDEMNRSIKLSLKVLRLLVRQSPWHEGILMEGSPYVNIGDKEFVIKARQKLVACEGFGFRDVLSVKKHHWRLKEIFRPSQEIENNVKTYMKRHGLDRGVVLVGIHIRRGDYRTYLNGKYYYDDDSWLTWITRVRSVFNSEARRFVGVVFSNEKVVKIIDSSGDLILGPGDAYEDLHLLSKCDYIIGPPSTFSGWASYIGRVPVHYLSHANTQIERNRFEIVEW